jgi:hypothetical protein
MASAVLLHPHPDIGGDMHNNVVSALYERLTTAGITAHRFNFASSDLDQAQQQTIAAIDAATEPVFLVGYSFGGGVAATIDHASVRAWCLIAPALTSFPSTIGLDGRPKQIIAAEHDAWLSPEVLAGATEGWVATSHVTMPGTDHFFGGSAADQAADLATAWLTKQHD